MENMPSRSRTIATGPSMRMTTQAGGRGRVQRWATQQYRSNVSQLQPAEATQLFIAGQGFWTTSYLLDGVVDMSYFDQTATVNRTSRNDGAGRRLMRNSANAPLRRGQYNRTRSPRVEPIPFTVRAYDYFQHNQMNARGWAPRPSGRTSLQSLRCGRGLEEFRSPRASCSSLFLMKDIVR